MNSSVIVLDTSSRRTVWRRAFPDSNCLFIGEADLPQFAEKQVVFVHETDLAPSCSSEAFVERRLLEIERNFGGNTQKAKTVCARIHDFRIRLRQWLNEGPAILLLYSGDTPSEVAKRNPLRAIKQNIAVLPHDRLRILPKRLAPDMDSVLLRLVANTCRFSVMANGDLQRDLAAAIECNELLRTLEILTHSKPKLLSTILDKAARDMAKACLAERQQIDPETLIFLLPHLKKIPL